MVLVSGATGFLGAYVTCYLLKQGRKVRAMKRSASSLKEFDYIYSLHFGADEAPRRLLEWTDADILDVPALQDAFKEVAEVYHCAAMVSFLQKDKEQMMKVNVEGTANMVNQSLEHGVKKFAHISSIAALGRTKPGEEVTEQSKWTDSKHNTNYAISKYKAEKEVWRGVEEGLHAVIVNPGVILGSGEWSKGSCKLFHLAWKGMPFYTTGVNGYVDVRDVAAATVMLMDKEIFNERFILVSENVEMRRFMNEASEWFGKKKPTVEVKKTLATLGWIVDAIRSRLKGKYPTITKETANASLKKFYYSSRKITEKTGFTFMPVSKTIQDACKDLTATKQI